MNISKINLVNFRNYSKLSINLGQNMNIFIGNNAQGKTNILESIMFLALTKSPRVFNESDLIKENYNIWRLMIDKKYQGQGFGKQTMDAAMNLIRTFPFGEAENVWLSYEPENTHARDFYRKYGFTENGEMCEDEMIAVYKL